MPTASGKSKSEAYDAVVVGAGVIGLAIARRAARAGLRTVVLEKDRAQWATGAAAGMLAPVGELDFGEQELLALSLAGAGRYPEFVAELEAETGLRTGYAPCGALAVALNRDDAEALRRLHTFQRSLGLDAQWKDAGECRILEPGLAPRIVGGVHTAHDHRVDPRALVRALERALEQAGGELRSDAPVAAVKVTSGRAVGVELESGETVAAEQVVVAAGCRSGGLGGLPEEARVPVRPVKGQVLTLRGREEAPALEQVIRTLDVYLVPRDDGRLVVGATVEERGFDTSVTAGGVFELLRAAWEVLPWIVELELIETVAGLRPAAPDNAPIVGPGSLPGLVWATAHWRNGILLAPVTADAVVEILTEGTTPEQFAPFSPERFAGSTAFAGRSVAS